MYIDKIKEIIQSSIDTKQKLLENEALLNTLESIVDTITMAFQNKKRIYFCGNGGSAADAQHLAAEFSGRFYTDRKALPAEALHCNSSYLTAVANDYGYELVYARLVEGIGEPGDILVGLSTSGNSANIVKAFEAAKGKGLITIAFTGITGGQMKSLADFLINIPSSDTPRIQESHIMAGHIICQLVEEKGISGLNREAIILAGGLGTRLREKVPDLPKCLAPIAGQPFLTHIIRYLLSQGVQHFIFSLGYRHEMIQSFLKNTFPTLSIQYSIEEDPLGTGGAIKLACEKASQDNVLVINGDTLFKVHLDAMMTFHDEQTADCTLALKPMEKIDRYGVVELNEDNTIRFFREKTYYDYGLINGGVYVLNVRNFLRQDLPQKFSFEKEYLETGILNRKLMGFIQNSYFIDIGTPTDFTRAQIELAPPLLDLHRVHKDWTLFLDRDGVINHEKKDGYILNRREFRFYDGVEEAFHLFTKKFGKIIVVSNQRGVGRGLMSESDLLDVHRYMKEQIESAGGRIDSIYYCTSTDARHPDRKPNPGMAIRAKTEFPGIEFSKSIIAGNKPSDMQFGRNACMHTVFLKTTHPEQPFPHPDIDLAFNSLNDLAKAL